MVRHIRIVSLLLILMLIVNISFINVSASEQNAWDNASPYMINELQEAQSSGLIPGCVSGADFTIPMTRAGFAHLVVLLCETYTGVSTNPEMIVGYPFTDTDDPVIYKAYGFGIVDAANIEGTLFAPDELIDRETMAYMLYSAIRLIAPLADYTISVIPKIPDMEQISEWAVPAVQYMYSRGMLFGGTGSVFTPRPITEEQIASKYGIATIEQCVVVAKRIFKLLPEIQSTRFAFDDKAAEVMSYAKDEPQSGKEIDRDELINLLRPYANKIRWAENIHATSFLGDYRKIGDGEWEPGYDSAFLYSAISISGANQYKYDDEQWLWGDNAGRNRFALNSYDGDSKILSTYEWNNTSGIGVEHSVPFQSFTMFSPSSLRNYMPSRLDWVYKIYNDEIVNGELCKVFSVTWLDNMIQGDESSPPAGGESSGPPTLEVEITDYYYISTVSGLCVVQKNYATTSGTTYQAIQIIFGISPSLTEAGTMEPPSDITFTRTWSLQDPDLTSIIGVNSVEPDVTQEKYETVMIGGSYEVLYRLPLLAGIGAENIESAYFLMKPTDVKVALDLRLAVMDSYWVSYSTDEWWQEYFSVPSTWNDVNEHIGEVIEAKQAMSDDGWYTIEMTSLVKDWLSGERGNFGFALSSDSETEFYAIESEYCPKLVITYRVSYREITARNCGKFGYDAQPPGTGNCFAFALRDRVMIGYYDLIDTLELEKANDEGGLDAALQYVKGRVIAYVEDYKNEFEITGFREIASFDAPIDPETEYRIAFRIGIGEERIIEGMLDFDYHFMMQLSDGSWAEKLPGEYSRLVSGSHAGLDPGTYPWNKGYMWGKGIEYNGFYSSDTVYFAVQKSGDTFTEHKKPGEV